MNYQTKEIKEIFKELDTSDNGLTSSEARDRRSRFGYNELKETKKISPFKIFLGQFASPVVWILIAALTISLLVGHLVDAVIIGIILVANAILGFFQEYRAEKAIEALKKIITQQATVIRDGKEQTLPAKELVPGDIIILHEGEKIPADARLLEANELKVVEASLTGESIPVTKKTGVCTETVIGNMFNIVFSGTAVATGTGKAIVVSTGMSTEIGKIADLLQETTTPPTPLQKNLKKLGVAIGIGVMIIAAVIFGLELLQRENIIDALISSLALAVAAVPEGLPAVITISLALGVQRMLKRNALVRKLPSVETLGSCTAICSDKTGTLTKGEMTVKKILVDDTTVLVSGTGYDPAGVFDRKPTSLQQLLLCGVLCNNAHVEKSNEGKWTIKGDPTEGALLTSGLKLGIEQEYSNHEYRRVKEIPFKSERKMMTVVCEKGKQRYVFSKGAPERILNLCSYILLDGKKRKITDADRKDILKNYQAFGTAALRVLGFAYKELKGKETEEKDLVFIGLQGMIDPPREEVKIAIERCKTAGIRTIMITGDYEITAKAIAQELGIPGKVMTGEQIDKNNLDAEIENTGIFARVDPKHKLLIVEALQKKGHIVAMTGDGVNDAPALKKADIGVAMGITGTDVTKESSQIVLMDDNFTSIVNAVEEGRTVFANIRKFVEYLFSSNIAEVLVIFLAILAGLPLPLIAIQILWINLLTDGFPALALGVDRAEKDIMLQRPRRKNNIITPWRWTYIIARGLLLTFITLALYNIYLNRSVQYAQTIVFTTLVMLQLLNAFALRSETRSVFGMSPFSNMWLIGAVFTSIALQLVAIYSPLAIYFRTTPLMTVDWIYIISATLIVLVFTEIVKFGRFMMTKVHSDY